MGRGKFKGKPTGHRHFSTPEELLAGSSARPRTFKKEEAEVEQQQEEESEEEVEDETEKRKGIQGLIEIENPNLVKQKNMKAGDADVGKTTELSRREREEIEKQKAHERYMRLQEQGKTEQARKDLVVHGGAKRQVHSLMARQHSALPPNTKVYFLQQYYFIPICSFSRHKFVFYFACLWLTKCLFLKLVIPSVNRLKK
ncbi:hypothetical protein SLEP1_g14526 [Rubroshorea leprosula]|uniref:Casein kinase substrate phosphoprotein PP28 domain-containing protein n=1 Tax=Rubroshorea leprosula TaxID=152421 RepID=A0AAV5IT85_9ROSI|nr:hypothetical protein SLEP1_g14526 [Rubroshorea leprosula]